MIVPRYYENQLSVCNQTNTLQNAITNGFNSLMADNAAWLLS